MLLDERASLRWPAVSAMDDIDNFDDHFHLLQYAIDDDEGQWRQG
jgi:hypothetical protein